MSPAAQRQTMPAVTLWQPHASLVAIGAKLIETRTWEPPADVIGERIAIHAGKNLSWLYMAELSPFKERLAEGRRNNGKLALIDGELPLGYLLATAVLTSCEPITADFALKLCEENPEEFAFGNYKPGRFAWRLTDVVTLFEPVEQPGNRRFFPVRRDLVAA